MEWCFTLLFNIHKYLPSAFCVQKTQQAQGIEFARKRITTSMKSQETPGAKEDGSSHIPQCSLNQKSFQNSQVLVPGAHTRYTKGLQDLDLKERVGHEQVEKRRDILRQDLGAKGKESWEFRLGTLSLFVPSFPSAIKMAQGLGCLVSSAVLEISPAWSCVRSTACKLICQFVQKLLLPTCRALLSPLREGIVLELAFWNRFSQFKLATVVLLIPLLWD